MDGQTVLVKPHPNDGFRDSVARRIEEKARKNHASNPDAWGSDRSLRACENLAGHVRGLPPWDPRFRQLLQTSSDSDHFTLSGEGATVIQRLGLDVPAPPDVDAVFTEFVVACGTRPAAAPGDSEKLKQLQAQLTASHRAATEREGALQAEIDQRDRKILEDSQELSDLRGEVNALGSGQVSGLSRKLAAIEGERDQALRRAAAAERKLNRRGKTTKAVA